MYVDLVAVKSVVMVWNYSCQLMFCALFSAEECKCNRLTKGDLQSWLELVAVEGNQTRPLVWIASQWFPITASLLALLMLCVESEKAKF